ncbi:MAG: DUF4476 domain-containing protein [Bacteroidia bacterium]|nr:DUF4476 domain-containing protein [Bacteroidia bacterium]
MFQKLKVLFYFIFYGLSVQAQNNSLVIFSESGHPFYLSVNHEQINKTAQSNVKVFDLNIGWNLVDIKIPGIVKELQLKDSILLSSKSKFLNKEFTYVLIEKDEKLSLQFKSVSEKSGPETPPVPEAPKEVIPLVDNSVYGNLYQAVNNKPVFFNNYDKETASCKITLTDKDIKYALNLFKKANDNETAYRYLNQIIDFNCYSVMQLKELLENTPIDMDRLNSAKRAYTHIHDVQNISALYSIFRYPVMKETYVSYAKEQENILKQKSLQCKEPVNEATFTKLFNSIKSTAYENEKLKLSKKLLVDVCLSSAQIKSLSELIVHDREKMDFMKYACNVLTDKENVLSLADEFQFSSSKEEFIKYISQTK